MCSIHSKFLRDLRYIIYGSVHIHRQHIPVLRLELSPFLQIMHASNNYGFLLAKTKLIWPKNVLVNYTLRG